MANNRGATYLMVLMIVMVMGIMLGLTGQSWRQTMQREREEELLFRGMQIKQALERWHNPGQGQPPASQLDDLKQLLRDPRSAANFKYLRRLYPDPFTNGDWKLYTEPGRGIVAVSSASSLRPIKQSGFPDELKEFAGREKYSEWVFAYRPASVGLQGGVAAGVPGNVAPPAERPNR